MRTLAVMHLPEMGGLPRILRPLLAAVAERGSLEVVAPGPGPVLDLYAPLATTTALRYEPLTAPRGVLGPALLVARLVRETRMFRTHMRQTRPDLVVVATAVLPSALLAARLERVPSVVYACEIFDNRFPRGRTRKLGGILLAGLTRRLARVVISCSRAVGDQFESRNGGGRHTLIYPGVEPRRREGQRDRFRRGYGIPDDALCLAVVGNISRGRGQDVAIRAVSLLRARRRDVRCLVVGSPHDRKVDRRYQAELERLVDDLALHGVVSFTGFVDRVDDVYAAADVVVNPARFDEPFGRVALEALAAGRPVVATRVGGIPEALRDGVDALLVEPDDPEAIAAAIERIAGDPGLGRKLVEQGRDRALREFSERAAVDAFERVVSSLLADPPGRAGVRARAAQ